MGEVGGRGWKFFDTRPCAKDEYFRAHQEKDIGSHLYIDPRRFYEVFLVSDFEKEWIQKSIFFPVRFIHSLTNKSNSSLMAKPACMYTAQLTVAW